MARQLKHLILAGAAAALMAAQGFTAGAAERPAATFTQPPSAARLKNGSVRIEFAVDRETDVAVTVLGASNRVLRHLGAGVLGANAPEPFKPGTLRQSLVWDGRDDRGVPCAAANIRVGLGTHAVFERVIGRRQDWLAPIHALATGPSGELFVFWDGGICVLDRHGTYKRQIVPAPAGMPADRLQGLKPVTLADGSVYFSDDYQLPGKKKYIGSMALTPQGQLLLPSPGSYPRRLARIGIDGSVAAAAFDTRLTQLADVGYLYLAASPDGKYLYVSGAEAGYRGDDARVTSYRQAVYRLKLDGRGPAEIWIGEDENYGQPGAFLHHPKGVATDREGRIYVCNYGADNIAVYTPGGGFLRRIDVKHPQQVAVHPASGKLYVLAGEEQGYTKYGYNFEPTLLNARLARFDAAGRQECVMELDMPHVRTGTTRPGGSCQMRFAADFSAKEAVLWLGVALPHPRECTWTLARVEEHPGGFGKPVALAPLPNDALIDPPIQLALDRTRDILYAHDGANKPHQSRLLRFSGDGRPLPPLLLKDADGQGEPWFFSEIAIGPDGDLFALAWKGLWNGATGTRLTRFSPDGLRLPMGDGPDGYLLLNVYKGSRGDSSRGFTVAPDGDIYALYYDEKRPPENRQSWEHGWSMNTAVARFSPEGKPRDMHVVAYLRSSAQGLRVDRNGAIYVGETMLPLGAALPADLARAMPDPLGREYPARFEDGRFDPTLRFMGTVIKFPAAGGRVEGVAEDDRTEATPARPAGDVWRPASSAQWTIRNNRRLRLTGAEWQFHGFSPIPAEYQGVTHVEHCICRGGRFDLDEFGRVYVPDNRRHRVTILDGAGNVVGRFGCYGNQDSAGPEIGLADPWWIAAAADRVYVGDGYARRIVKVRLASSVEAACAILP